MLSDVDLSRFCSVSSRTGSPVDLSPLPDPLVADPLDAQCCRTGSMQGELRPDPLHVQVVPEHGRPLPGSGRHAEVGESCVAANQTGEIEHDCGHPGQGMGSSCGN